MSEPAGDAPQELRHAEEVMGTVFSFDVRGGEPEAVRTALEEAIARLHRVDEVFSTYREDSQISRLVRGEITVEECDPGVAEVLELSLRDVRDGYEHRRLVRRGVPFKTDTYTVGEAMIWGATARIVSDLLERLAPLLEPAR